MTVSEFSVTDETDFKAEAELFWRDAPGLRFNLVMTQDGRVEELRVRTIEPRGSVGTRSLRSVPIGLMQRTVRRDMAKHAQAVRAAADHWSSVVLPKRPDLKRAAAQMEEAAKDAERIARDFTERPRPGAAGRDDEKYAAIAAMYVDLLSERAPVAKLAARLGVSRSTASNYLFAARERGLLTTTGQGRAGGSLTDRAEELLRETD